MTQLHGNPAGVHVHGTGSYAAGGVPTITSPVTVLGGTSISVAWTGTADEYRLNGGTATALPDGTSPDTITGLTPNTPYTIELRLAPGAWSASESFTTDNTGSGGGAPATYSIAVARSTTAVIGGGLR